MCPEATIKGENGVEGETVQLQQDILVGESENTGGILVRTSVEEDYHLLSPKIGGTEKAVSFESDDNGLVCDLKGKYIENKDFNFGPHRKTIVVL